MFEKNESSLFDRWWVINGETYWWTWLSVRRIGGLEIHSDETRKPFLNSKSFTTRYFLHRGSVLTRYVPAQNTNKPKNMWWLSILLVCLFGKGLRWATGLITPTPVSLVAIPVEFWTETPRKIVLVCVGGFSIRPSRLQSRITCSIFQAEYLEEKKGMHRHGGTHSKLCAKKCQNSNGKVYLYPGKLFSSQFCWRPSYFLVVFSQEYEEDLEFMKT